MEGVDGTQEAPKLASVDVLSSMPENVIANIMNRLPIRDAVRTSILATNWTLKWTLLTHIKVDYTITSEQFKVLGPNKKEYYDGRMLSRLLLNLKGPVIKFVLEISSYYVLDFEDINHWVLFLSGKEIKDFTVINTHKTTLKLPTHLFSCRELTHLKLHKCCFRRVPRFCGFPNLLSLDMYWVTFENGNCGEIITQCSLLEILKISYHSSTGNVKLEDFTKLKNLKVLALPLCKLDNITSSSIFELGGYLPKLEVLSLDFQKLVMKEACATEWPNTTFPCLKTLTLDAINFGCSNMLGYAFDIICASQNLQTLEIEAAYSYGASLEQSGVDFSRLIELQLQNVVFSAFRGSENEIHLISYILDFSPYLKKMAVHLNSHQLFGGDNGKLIFATKLLKLHRASHIAEVEMSYYSDFDL